MVDIKKNLEDCGALLEGHFLLTSGKHSDGYVQCAKLLMYPDVAAESLKPVVEKVKDMDFIVLAGYMRILSPYFLENYNGKIINIHPSLLPLYKGINSIERAYNNKDPEIGISIHYVNEEVDGGEILAQDKFKVDYNESLDEVTNRVHQLEHRLYPKTLINIFKEYK